MKLCLVLVLTQTAWLPSALALYHQRTMNTIIPATHQNNSYFGFSITYSKDLDKKLIVGAPQGNDIGEVHSCDVETKACTVIPMNINRNDDTYKHNYWLGATLKATSSHIYSCAPRYVSSISLERNTASGSTGVCLKVAHTKNGYSKGEGLPSITDQDRKHNSMNKFELASDTLGWSLDIAEQNNTSIILVGGPALSTGRVSEQMIVDYSATNSTYSGVTSYTGGEYDIKFNFGYSIAFGSFYQPNVIYFAIGSPYGTSGYGKIVTFRYNTAKSKRIKMEKLEPEKNGVGFMYGAVLCAAQLSNAERATAALLVGAPGYAEEHDYDVGAVYVYVKIRRALREVRVIKGTTSGGYFGSAIANVGDLNGDHADEVVIAAPYEAEGRGAVYVYCGESIVDTHGSPVLLQILEPLPGNKVHGFGLALSPLADYDQNGCNELAIGAPYSNSVFVLRCFAAVTLKVYAVIPDLRGRDSSHFKFDACFNVTYPDKPIQILGSVNVSLSINHPQAYLANSKDSNYIVSLEDRNQPAKCRKVEVATPKGNYELPIEWKMTAVQMDSPLKDAVFNPSRVLVSERSQLSAGSTVRAAECNGTCEPKLSLQIYTNTPMEDWSPYQIGSSDAEVFVINVTNSGDIAYESCVRLRVEGTPVLNGSQTDCQRNAESMFTCTPRTPLLKMDHWHPEGNFTLDMTKLTSENTEIQIFVDLYPRCDGTNKTEHNKTLYLEKDRKFKINTRTSPEEVIKISSSEMKYTGKQVEHIYTINNIGKTNWVNLVYTLTYIKKPYLEQSIPNEYGSMSNSKITYIATTETTKEIAFKCEIKELKSGGRINIIAPITILANKLDGLLKNENLTVDTYLSLEYDEDIKRYNITSPLVLNAPVVPTYLIVAAICLGLLLLGILAWALYECGFLKRKKQDELKNLKKEVRRQTIRRSMVNSETRGHLGGVPEENEATCTIEPSEELEDIRFKKSTEELVKK